MDCLLPEILGCPNATGISQMQLLKSEYWTFTLNELALTVQDYIIIQTGCNIKSLWWLQHHCFYFKDEDSAELEFLFLFLQSFIFNKIACGRVECSSLMEQESTTSVTEQGEIQSDSNPQSLPHCLLSSQRSYPIFKCYVQHHNQKKFPHFETKKEFHSEITDIAGNQNIFFAHLLNQAEVFQSLLNQGSFWIGRFPS